MTAIGRIRRIITELHGVKATHRESVPVKEVFQGQTVWDGIVEVFTLHGHPKTDTVYAWFHEKAGSIPGTAQLVTVLHIHPALTPVDAVRSFIVQEARNANA
jgi:hypothetical protein